VIGRHELASRWENAKRAIRDNGVTYNVYGDPEGVDRPWTLDMMPAARAVRGMEAARGGAHAAGAVAQSAAAPISTDRSDCCESSAFRTARIRQSWFPAAVPRDRGASRTSTCTCMPSDLARSPDGAWWVLADRTQAPSGAGYTLENRIVMSRSLPEAFRDCHVQRLASFFWVNAIR
jgi:uncharacterized circularly permuted ATP-grasp superfamily protein